MSKTFRTRFFDKVCPWDWILSIAFGVNIVLLVMLGLTFLLGPQSEGTKVVSLLALTLIAGTLVIVVPLLVLCQRRSGINIDTSDD